MSVPESEQTYLGVPLPSPIEHLHLEVVRDYLDEDEGVTGLEGTFDSVVAMNQHIESFLLHCADLAAADEAHMPETVASQIKAGVWVGFELVVGSVTHVQFLRSRHETEEAFLAEASRNRSLPLATIEEVRYAMQMLNGNIPLEPGEDLVTDPTEAFVRTTVSYLARAQALADLIGDEIEDIDNNFELDEEASPEEVDIASHFYARGFHKGIMYALVAYIYTDEYRVLEAVRKNSKH
jgi:hypothetical protein